MIISAELTVNPGAKTLFLAEVRLERNVGITPKWWGLWLGWWLYRPTHWRTWLYGWERSKEGDWRTWQLRLLGFEINWQHRMVKHGWAG